MLRDESCPHCGLTYEKFKADDQPRFHEAQIMMLDRAKELAAKGDYSKPPRRAAILGYMHEWKWQWWELHLELCEHEADAVPF